LPPFFLARRLQTPFLSNRRTILV